MRRLTGRRSPREGAIGVSEESAAPAAWLRLGWMRLTVLALSLAVLLGSTATYVAQAHFLSLVKTVEVITPGAKDRPTVSPLAGDAMNLLVAGVTSRADISQADLVKYHLGTQASSLGNGSDTLMIVHIAKNTGHVTVISLPRDSLVTIPAWKGRAAHPDKINAAFTIGGAPLMFQTVELATGIHLDHYVQVGFTGFLDMVSAIGGVDICLPAPVKDDPRYTNLNLPAGTSHLDPVMAINYVRSRHAYASSDFGRIQAQQRFIASVFKKVTGTGVLLNPISASNFITAVLKSLVFDKGLANRDALMSLAQRAQGLNLKQIEFTTVPVAPGMDNYNPPGTGLTSMIVWDPIASKKMFQEVRDDLPISPEVVGKKPAITMSPSSIYFRVYNGTGTATLGATAASAMLKAGFNKAAGTQNAASNNVTRTYIVYDPAWNQSIKTIEAALPYALVVPKVGNGRVFKIYVGADYSGVRKVTLTTSSASNPTLSSTTANTVVCPG